jgi:hypothetical protein
MRTSPLATLLLLLVLGACDQKDPGVPGGGDGGGASDNSYFPLLEGSRYEYLHSNGGWTEIVEIMATGEGAIEQHQSGDPDGESSVSTFAVVDGDVLRVAEDQLVDGELLYSAVYDPGFLRFSAGWAEADEGFEETRTYDRTETEAGMEPKDPQPRAHTFTVESTDDTVTVPAGTFRNCVRVRRVRALGDPSIDDPMQQEEQDKLYWFAPGVGKVREENTVSGTTELLTTYEIGEE